MEQSFFYAYIAKARFMYKNIRCAHWYHVHTVYSFLRTPRTMYRGVYMKAVLHTSKCLSR